MTVPILVSVRYFVGLRSMSGGDIKFDDMKRIPGEEGISSYTVIPCRGFYRGGDEDSVIIEVHQEMPSEECTTPRECVSEIKKLNVLASTLRRRLDQQVVIVEVVIRSLTQRFEWTHWSKADSGSVFPFPAHVASLVWDVPGDSQELDMPGFFKGLTKSAKDKCEQRFIPYDDLPLFVVRATNSIELDLEEEIDNEEKCRAFDNSIVGESQESPERLDDRSFGAGTYIARFRQASKSPVFIVDNLDRLLSPTENDLPRMFVNKAPYREGLGCSEMAYLDLLEGWLTDNTVEFNKQKFLGCKRAMLTVLALTRVKDKNDRDKIVIKRRSGNVGIYPNQCTCAPWGHLEPLLRAEPSVVDIFLQELDEELFGGPNIERDYHALTQRLAGLQGKLRYLGYAVDLLRPMVHILLTFEPSPEWWKKNRCKVRLNWEYEDEALELLDVVDVAKGTQRRYVPTTVAAARLI